MVEVLAALRGYCMPASTREDALARIFPSVPTQVSTRGCLRVANGEDCHRASGAARTATPSSRGFVERMAYDSLQVAKLIPQNVDEMKSCQKSLRRIGDAIAACDMRSSELIGALSPEDQYHCGCSLLCRGPRPSLALQDGPIASEQGRLHYFFTIG